MKIKRNFEKLVVTKRRLVFHQTSSVKQTVCVECGEPMLTIEQAAVLFGFSQRRIFQFIEANATHFTESETGAAMICISSMTEFVRIDERA